MMRSAKPTKNTKESALVSASAKLCRYLFLALPAVLFFSYHPVISLGENSLMNFELSLPEIWLIVFFLAALPQLPRVCKFYGLKKLILAAVMLFYLSLSVLWSANRPRTILAAGILWLLVYAVLNLVFFLKNQRGLKDKMEKSLLLSAGLVSIFCLFQCVADLLGLPRENTLLCIGCVSEKFGFPHVNGFAIEPQFMGNLLIAPILLAFHLLFAPAKNKQKQILPKKLLIPLTLILTITLFLTLSRGAIYACTLALIAEQVLLHRTNIKPILKSAGFFLTGFLITLSLQGLFAAVGPTNDDFISGVTKSVHQLSLGKIDLRPDSAKQSPDGAGQSTSSTEQATDSADQLAETAETTEAIQTADGPRQSLGPISSQFSGYVAESTDIRLGLNGLAFKTWKSRPQYILLGTGLGSAGPAMHAYAPEGIGEKEIVQNEYMSLLLETGLVGCLLVLAVAIYAAAKLKVHKNTLLFSLLFGFLITLFFFSGLPNALHIYLLPTLFV